MSRNNRAPSGYLPSNQSASGQMQNLLQFQNQPIRTVTPVIKANRFPKGQESRGVDDVFGTNLNANYKQEEGIAKARSQNFVAADLPINPTVKGQQDYPPIPGPNGASGSPGIPQSGANQRRQQLPPTGNTLPIIDKPRVLPDVEMYQNVRESFDSNKGVARHTSASTRDYSENEGPHQIPRERENREPLTYSDQGKSNAILEMRNAAARASMPQGPQEKYKLINEKIDLESKVSETERMVGFLGEQMNQMQRFFNHELKKAKLMIDGERDIRTKIETSLRQAEEQVSLLNTELLNRISAFESRLGREEKNKADLKERLLMSEQAHKEMLNYVKSLQGQENNELLEMRGFLHEKITEDHGIYAKEKEKSKALFNEMVRLGEVHEKTQEQLTAVNMALEARLQALESKLVMGEKSLQTVVNRGDTSIGYMNDWNEKLEHRVQDMEAALVMLGREQNSDKNSLNRIEVTNNRITEDLKALLMNMQGDFQARLDNRVLEMVNRIVMEHEERRRSDDDLKNQIEMKEKLTSDKMNYEREEMRDRYMSMDSLVRAEFQRKDEAIRAVQSLLENSVRALQTSIKQEEYTREQFEEVVRSEMGNMHEHMKKEMESFKQFQVEETGKLTEILRSEIDARFSSDVELKNLANMISNTFASELLMLKEAIEKQNKSFAKELKEVAVDSAEKDNQLSRFIEDECQKIVEALTARADKLKGLISRLAEQFKNHLVANESSKKEIFRSNEITNERLKEGLESLRMDLGVTKGQLDNRIADEISRISNETKTNYEVLEDAVVKLNEREITTTNLLKEAIENTRSIFNQKVDKLAELSETYHRNNFENIKMLVDEVDAAKEVIIRLKDETAENMSNLLELITRAESSLGIALSAETSARTKQVEGLNDLVSKNGTEIWSKLKQIQLVISNNEDDRHGDVTKIGKDIEITIEKMKNLSAQVNDLTSNAQVLQDAYKADLGELASRQMLIELLLRAESGKIYTDIQKVVDLVEAVQRKQVNATGKVDGSLSEAVQKLGSLEEDFTGSTMDEKIERKMDRAFEKIKGQNQKIWDACLDYSAGKVPEETFKSIMENQSLKNQYVFAVGNQDTYSSPMVFTQGDQSS